MRPKKLDVSYSENQVHVSPIGTVLSQLVMSRMVKKGLARPKARELAFRNADRAIVNNMTYLEALLSDYEIMQTLTEEDLREVSDHRTNLGMSREIVERIVKRYLKK